MKFKVLQPIWTPKDAREAAQAAGGPEHPAIVSQRLDMDTVTLVRDGELTQEWDALGATPCPVVDLFTREVR